MGVLLSDWSLHRGTDKVRREGLRHEPAAAVQHLVVYPFTVLGSDFVASGFVNGGGYVPPVWQDVSVAVPAYDQTVQVGKVTYIGHDDTSPVGEQDRFMLDDSTLGWGTKQDDGHITVSKTQTAPGVGPTDDGRSLVKLTAASQPADNSWVYYLTAALTVAGLCGGIILAVLVRRRRAMNAPTTYIPSVGNIYFG